MFANVLCRSDVGGSMSRVEQLLEDHSRLRQGLKRLQLDAKVTNFIKKNTSNKMHSIIMGFDSYGCIYIHNYRVGLPLVKIVQEGTLIT
jgi:hypothetical protein